MDQELLSVFQNPGNDLRGTPFWAWNTRMTEENIDYTIDAMEKMGMGGGCMHVRTGLDNVYLSDEFFSLIRHARERLRGKGMYTCLYDEDRWPSGMAGHIVSEDRRYRQRFLVFSSTAPERFPVTGPSHVEGTQFSGDRKLLAVYALTLKDGLLTGTRLIGGVNEARPGEQVRYAWQEINANLEVVDTLSPAPARRFLEVTHEAYKREVGDGFGKDIPWIFSDEPAFATMDKLSSPDSADYVTLPWTDDLDAEYQKAYGESLIPHIPELIYLGPDGRLTRAGYRYHDLTCELFCTNFLDQIGSWCRKNNLQYTGHVFREDELDCETYAVGEAMRCYRGFDIPGVDVLSDRRRITTVKQVQSAARQLGKKRVTCEIYGVTNWCFDFRGHKLSGDWQAALGVTNRVHHLCWTSMRGNAKRDYPASIGPQSPWYADYSRIETHFARINALMTRGDACVKVGVIHPIESYWLYWGPENQTAALREEMNERWKDLTNTLLYGLIDFDFISEGLLRDLPGQSRESVFRVGESRYDVVIVPCCHTLKRGTAERLRRFAEAGGRVIYLESKPFLIDAAPDAQAASLPGEVIPYSAYSVLTALESVRTLDVRTPSGSRAANLFSQLRRDGEDLYLFLSHVQPPRNADIPEKEHFIVSVKGEYRVTLMDTLTGETHSVFARREGGKTLWETDSFAHDSFLYVLEPGKDASLCRPESGAPTWQPICLPGRAPYLLMEQNVLVLDTARISVNGAAFSQALEMRAADRYVRSCLSMEPMRGQPWRNPEVDLGHGIELEFRFEADGAYPVTLVSESPQGLSARLNGFVLSCEETGFYIDPDLKKLGSGITRKGENVLLLRRPYTSRTILENVYLLGDFGVEAAGQSVLMTSRPETLAFTDLGHQRLSFYSGSFLYRIPFTLEKAGRLKTQVSFFRSPLIKVRLDEEKEHYIDIAPYEADLGFAEAGDHTLTVTVSGNRENTMGALHLADRSIPWKGPNMWTALNESRSDEYQIKEFGLLKAPELWINYDGIHKE